MDIIVCAVLLCTWQCKRFDCMSNITNPWVILRSMTSGWLPSHQPTGVSLLHYNLIGPPTYMRALLTEYLYAVTWLFQKCGSFHCLRMWNNTDTKNTLREGGPEGINESTAAGVLQASRDLPALAVNCWEVGERWHLHFNQLIQIRKQRLWLLTIWTSSSSTFLFSWSKKLCSFSR